MSAEPVDDPRAVDRAQRRPDDGHAQGAADLAHGVVDRRAGTGLAGGSAPMIASVAGLTDSASPAAISTIETTIRPQYAVSSPVVAATAKPVLMVSSPTVDHELGAEPVHQDDGHRRQRTGHQRERQGRDAGPQGRVAAHDLEVLGDHEDEPEQAEERQRDRPARRRETRVAEQPHVQQRVAPAQLPARTNAASDTARRRTRAASWASPSRAPAPRWWSRPAGRCRRSSRTAPTGSNRPGASSRLSGTSRSPASSAITAIGTLTQSTEPQAKCSSSRPPLTGPSATPEPGHAGPEADRGGALAPVA